MLTLNFIKVRSFTTLDDALYLKMQFFEFVNSHAHIDTNFILERYRSESFIPNFYVLFLGFSIACIEQLLVNSLYYYTKVLSHFEHR